MIQQLFTQGTTEHGRGRQRDSRCALRATADTISHPTPTASPSEPGPVATPASAVLGAGAGRRRLIPPLVICEGALSHLSSHRLALPNNVLPPPLLSASQSASSLPGTFMCDRTCLNFIYLARLWGVCGRACRVYAGARTPSLPFARKAIAIARVVCRAGG